MKKILEIFDCNKAKFQNVSTSADAPREPKIQKEVRPALHDGIRQGVATGFESDLVKTLHEQVHDFIFFKTSDGLLHAFIKHRKKLENDGSNILNACDTFLHQSTELAHERAATYIGIHHLPNDDDIEKEISKLDQKYRSYYDFYHALVDKNISNKVISFDFAWAVTTWSFSSNRISALSADAKINLMQLKNSQGPTERQNALLQAFRKKDFTTKFQAFLGTLNGQLNVQGLHWTDVLSADEWSDRSDEYEFLAKTELFLMETFCGWLSANMALPTVLAADIPISAKKSFQDHNFRASQSGVESEDQTLDAALLRVTSGNAVRSNRSIIYRRSDNAAHSDFEYGEFNASDFKKLLRKTDVLEVHSIFSLDSSDADAQITFNCRFIFENGDLYTQKPMIMNEEKLAGFVDGVNKSKLAKFTNISIVPFDSYDMPAVQKLANLDRFLYSIHQQPGCSYGAMKLAYILDNFQKIIEHEKGTLSRYKIPIPVSDDTPAHRAHVNLFMFKVDGQHWINAKILPYMIGDYLNDFAEQKAEERTIIIDPDQTVDESIKFLFSSIQNSFLQL